EVDRRGLGEVSRRDGNVAEPEAMVDRLGQELRVKHEIIGIFPVRNGLKHLPPVDTKPRMKIAQILAEHGVFDYCQHAVGDVLVDWHAAVERLAPRADPRGDDDIADVRLDEANSKWYDTRIVLVVRMNHHNHIGAAVERRVITSFLV